MRRRASATAGDGTIQRIAGIVLVAVVVASIVGFSGLVDLGSSGRAPDVPSPFGTLTPGAPPAGSTGAPGTAVAPSLPPYPGQSLDPGDLTLPGSTAAPAPAGAVPLESLPGEVVQSPLTVAAPPGTTAVVWVVDDDFEGKDTHAPYALALTLRRGEHHLSARATVAGVTRVYRARFTVSGAAGARDSAAPAPARRS